MRVALVYLFESAVVDTCERVAERLCAGRSVLACVGRNAAPHLTLVHVEVPGNGDLDTIWREAVRDLPALVTLEFLALGTLAYEPAAGAMAWVIVPCTPALRAAEQAALALPSLRGLPVMTQNGEHFQPHLTLAIWQGSTAPQPIELPRELLPRQGVVGRLALGEIGPHGTYLRTFQAT